MIACGGGGGGGGAGIDDEDEEVVADDINCSFDCDHCVLVGDLKLIIF